MATIVDLSNEPKFTIKAAAWQTGIRPVTLRAWERRHEILTPHRTENQYRLYSERDIAILRWLKYRVDAGVSIGSAVNELRSMTKKSVWPEAAPQAPAPTPAPTPENFKPARYTAQLAHALMRHDENEAGELLRELNSQFDLLAVFVDVLAPAIQQIRQARFLGEISPSDERFTTSYLRCKLLSMLPSYPSRSQAPLVIIGCAPMEVFELQGIMLTVLLRREGFRVEYLGPDIPLEDLADYAIDVQPALVVLSASSDFTARQLRGMQARLKRIRSAPVFAFCGEVFDQDANLRKETPGVYLGGLLNSALSTARSLLKARQTGNNRAAQPVLMTYQPCG
jgi:MerR family transcriptional regulator, light-induced transcriptional regulator